MVPNKMKTERNAGTLDQQMIKMMLNAVRQSAADEAKPRVRKANEESAFPSPPAKAGRSEARGGTETQIRPHARQKDVKGNRQ